ncbi:MAG: alpha/beta hydrolase, partial [Deltaproteobacteria bacterium]|nr:alpha/beta hydrolase [Deltaproteobacteria bacterium]
LILHGRQDQVIPLEHAQRLHQGLPNSDLIILESCGHAAVWDAHGQIKKEILNFLKENP